MSVKRHGAKWRADWRDAFHIRRRKDFDTKAEAEGHERQMRLEAREGTDAAPDLDIDITVSEYTKVWLGKREAQGIDPGTVHRQEIALRRHILPRFGQRKVREISRSKVRAFILAKLGEDAAQGMKPGAVQRTHRRLARGSVRQIYSTLSALLSEAVEDRLVKSNVVSGLWRTILKGKKSADTPKVRAMDAAQTSAFLATARAIEPKHFPYLATLMLAGLRPSEGLAVTAGKIDYAKRTLLVDAQVGQHGGLKATKTGEERSVDLSRTLLEILRAAAGPKTAGAKVVSISGEAVAEPTERPGPWLFYPELGTAPSHKDAFRVYKAAIRAMRRVLTAASLPSYFGLHSLRHTFATGLVSAGISPAYVQQQMGHSDMAFTVRVYGSWLPVRVPGAVDALAELLAGHDGHQMDTQATSTEKKMA